MIKRPRHTVLLLCVSLLAAFVLSLSSCVRNGFGGDYSPEEKALLSDLDDAVSRRKTYYAKKEAVIDSLRKSLKSVPSDSAKLGAMGEMSEAFLSYRFDSAFHYVHQSKELLSRNPSISTDEVVENRLDEILVLTSAGLFNEATDLLRSIDTLALTERTKAQFLRVSFKTYYDLTLYTRSINVARSLYRSKTLAIGKELLSLLPQDDWEHSFVLGHERIMAGDEEGAVQAFGAVFGFASVPSHSLSMTHAILGDLYAEKGQNTESLRHYALSALIDIKEATRENTSLLKLSRLLLDLEDLDRSYRYAETALEDATFYNAYHRKIAVGDVLPLIEKQRYLLLDAQKKTLSSGFTLVVLLCLALLGLSVIIFRQVKKLRKAHRTIAAHNASLSAVNKELSEANAIKDEYIGLSFFNDSAHIKKMEGLYRFVNNKLRDRKYTDIKTAFDPDSLHKERESMYANFDATFLRLFPNFIERYNDLFPPEDRIQPPIPGHLTTEMRIFALIRLGINKSDDIAGFLDYSVHTINTYKTRVKNRSSVDNALFEDAILAIDATVQ